MIYLNFVPTSEKFVSKKYFCHNFNMVTHNAFYWCVLMLKGIALKKNYFKTKKCECLYEEENQLEG